MMSFMVACLYQLYSYRYSEQVSVLKCSTASRIQNNLFAVVDLLLLLKATAWANSPTLPCLWLHPWLKKKTSIAPTLVFTHTHALAYAQTFHMNTWKKTGLSCSWYKKWTRNCWTHMKMKRGALDELVRVLQRGALVVVVVVKMVGGVDLFPWKLCSQHICMAYALSFPIGILRPLATSTGHDSVLSHAKEKKKKRMIIKEQTQTVNPRIFSPRKHPLTWHFESGGCFFYKLKPRLCAFIIEI